MIIIEYIFHAFGLAGMTATMILAVAVSLKIARENLSSGFLRCFFEPQIAH